MKHRRATTQLTLALLLAAALPAVLPISQSWADTAKAARFYEDGLSRYEKNDNAGAIIQLKNALQQDASYLSAYLLLGQAQFRAGDVAAAELSLTTALKMGADRSEVVGLLADAYLLLGKYRDLLEKIHPTGLPANTATNVWLARAYASLALNDFPGAETAISSASALTPNSAKVSIARGMFHLQRGNLTEARRFADLATSADAKEPRAWNLKASIAHATGNAPGALDGYARALALEPNFLDVRVARAGLLLDLDRLDDAGKDLKHLEKSHPEEPRAAYLRSVYFSRKGDTRAANAQLLQAAKVIGGIPPEFLNGNAQLLMLGALSNYAIKAYEQAQGHIAGYIKLKPKEPGARKLLGAILLARKQTDAAITQLEYAYRAAPNDPSILNMLASAYMSGNQHTKAANLLENAGPVALQSSELASTLGYSLIGLGRQEQGIEYLSQAYAKNPANFRLGSSLVMFNIQRGNPREAIRVAEAYRAKNPKDPGAHNLVGVAKAGARDHAGARQAYEKAIATAPNFHAARLNLGKIELAQGRYDSARKQFQAVLKAQPKNVQAQFEMGNTELAAGRASEGLRWIQAAHGQNTANSSIAVKLIDTHLLLGQTDNALALAKQTAASATENFDVLSALGRAHAAAGQTDRAKSTFANMSKLAGFNVGRLEETARLQLKLGDLAGALHSLNKALSDTPNALTANSLMAELEQRQGQTTQAQDRAKRLVNLHPKSAKAHSTQGDVAMASRQYGLAASAYQSALRLENQQAYALRYTQALQAHGQGAQAIAFLEDWSRKNPNATEAKIVLGGAQLNAREFTKARATYENYLKQHGDHAMVLNNLATVLIKQGGDMAQALALAERAYKLAPNAAPVNDTLGWLLFKRGDNERSLRHLREARSRAPDSAEIRYHLAAVLHKTGRKAEAKRELDAALAKGDAFDELEDAKKLRLVLSAP